MKKQEVLSLLKDLDTYPKRSLGQNFLVNPQICQQIISEVYKEEVDRVIEIGPGLGVLTEALKKVSDLILIEKDKVFAEYLRQKGFLVLNEDALLSDWNDLIKGNTLLVGNLPYQISSRLLVERSLDKKPLQKMILMFQTEVAQRILSQFGCRRSETFGLLSVMAQNHWHIEKVLNAGPKDFYPSPNVGSQVLKFTPKSFSDPFNSRWFLNFLKIGFSQRRKMLQKVLLLNIDKLKTDNIITKDQVKEAFKSLNIAATVRPHELSSQKWLDLFNLLFS